MLLISSHPFPRRERCRTLPHCLRQTGSKMPRPLPTPTDIPRCVCLCRESRTLSPPPPNCSLPSICTASHQNLLHSATQGSESETNAQKHRILSMYHLPLHIQALQEAPTSSSWPTLALEINRTGFNGLAQCLRGFRAFRPRLLFLIFLFVFGYLSCSIGRHGTTKKTGIDL